MTGSAGTRCQTLQALHNHARLLAGEDGALPRLIGLAAGLSCHHAPQPQPACPAHMDTHMCRGPFAAARENGTAPLCQPKRFIKSLTRRRRLEWVKTRTTPKVKAVSSHWLPHAGGPRELASLPNWGCSWGSTGCGTAARRAATRVFLGHLLLTTGVWGLASPGDGGYSTDYAFPPHPKVHRGQRPCPCSFLAHLRVSHLVP